MLFAHRFVSESPEKLCRVYLDDAEVSGMHGGSIRLGYL